uniref:Testis expressed 26 n=1 Tax=Pygocentrus nattereri TaxID=42514 RepID=A0AAR2JF75_PYGNA
MASWDKNWDPYETSQRREFVYRPNSSTPVLRPLTTNAYKNSYDLTDPVGRTAYSEDFYWKPPSKPVCIRTGSASGNRKNNPHPSQAFLVWRLPPGLKLCKNPPSEEEVRKVLSAQYKSTYSTDFLDLPKVPTVVHKHITNQESRKQLTTYDRHFGGKCTDLSSTLKFLQPEELQQFYKHLPEKEKVEVQASLQRALSPPGQVKKTKDSVGLSRPLVLDRVSVWPGPL